jgi:hypothetical protein
MELVTEIDPALRSDPELLAGIEALNGEFRRRAAKLPDFVGGPLRVEWLRPSGGPGELSVEFRMGDERVSTSGVVREETLRTAAMGTDKTDPAFWMFGVWDDYLKTRIEHSLRRAGELMATAEG